MTDNGHRPPSKRRVPHDDPDAPDPADGQLLADFGASVRRMNIPPAGDPDLVLSVPYHEKANALPLTDLRGVQLRIKVYMPGADGDDEEVLAFIERLEAAEADRMDGAVAEELRRK